jgi:hypothetical protein
MIDLRSSTRNSKKFKYRSDLNQTIKDRNMNWILFKVIIKTNTMIDVIIITLRCGIWCRQYRGAAVCHVWRRMKENHRQVNIMARAGMDTAGSYFLNPNPSKCTQMNSFSLVFRPDNRLYPPDRHTVDSDFTGYGQVISFWSALVSSTVALTLQTLVTTKWEITPTISTREEEKVKSSGKWVN